MTRQPIILENKDHSAITEQQMRAFAPVLFNDTPRKQMSDSYMPVKSWDIIQELRLHDYVPTQIQLRNRHGAMDTTAHSIRFSQVGARSKMVVRGDVSPQLYMRNALDGSAMLGFWNGLLRMICSNGLIVSDASIAQPLAVRHLAVPALAAIIAIEEISAQSKVMFQHIDAMRTRLLSDKLQLRMASSALAIMDVKGVIKPGDLLAPRRPDDAGADVWRVFNRIQENIIRGGVTGTTATNRPTRTRGLTGIGAQLHANTALWSLAMEAIGRASDSSKSAVRVLDAARATDVMQRATGARGSAAPAPVEVPPAVIENVDANPAPAIIAA